MNEPTYTLNGGESTVYWEDTLPALYPFSDLTESEINSALAGLDATRRPGTASNQ